ncbi:MAG TPA: hypothetical protein VNG12_12490 [Acidimicrobiales bacterium]|nr:hypothetical protein [Acidimicrobiales bacterium]
MPNFFVAQAVAATKDQESLQYAPRPPLNRAPNQKPFDERALAHQIVGEGEVISEETATQRLAKMGIKTDDRVVVNGTSQILATWVNRGYLVWQDWHLGLLERAKPTPRPVVRSVYCPEPAARESKEIRSMRGELRQLRAMVDGRPELMPAVRVAEGRALVRNPYGWSINQSPLGVEVGPFEVIETDAETAAKSTATGIFVQISAEQCSRLMASAV